MQVPGHFSDIHPGLMPRATDDLKTEYVVLPAPDGSQKSKNAATGASAAGIRALSSQLVAFYFRTPIKAFFRTRFDYTGFARAINPYVQANERWSWRVSTPGLLAHAIKEHGWGFLPNQVLPPMLANVTVGAILYTGMCVPLRLCRFPCYSAILPKTNLPAFNDLIDALTLKC